MSESDCRCPKPKRPTGREPEQLPPWKCLTCGGYACEYAPPDETRCPPSICDCFIATYPDSPRALHPEAFAVRTENGWFVPDPRHGGAPVSEDMPRRCRQKGHKWVQNVQYVLGDQKCARRRCGAVRTDPRALPPEEGR